MDKCKNCGSKNIVGIEYSWDSPYYFDGVSEWDCQDCGYRENRFTGKELKEGEVANWKI
jgi:C4-type Zn-finger protein